jgi:hypothetical protein
MLRSMFLGRRGRIAITAGGLLLGGWGCGRDIDDAASPTYVSLLYYPGWVQNSLAPTDIDYAAVSHIMHFGFDPTTAGTMCTCDMQSTLYPPVAIAAAHAAGKKIVVVVGGEGQGENFVGATGTANLATFIDNIVTLKNLHGYDGVDIDWEESVTEAPYVALVQGLRTAMGPDVFLSIDVDTGQHPPEIVAAAEPYVTMINDMTYWDSGETEQSAYEHAGVPAYKLTLGVGYPHLDQTQADVQRKVSAIESSGWAGAMEWQVGDLSPATEDERLAPLRTLMKLTR